MFRPKPRNRPEAKSGARTPLAYYRPAPEETPSPFKRAAKPADRRRRLGRLADWLAIIILVALAVYGLSLGGNPKLKIDSGDYRLPSVYQQAVAEATVSYNYHNKLTFDEAALTAALKKRFPEINTVSVGLPLLGRTPSVSISIAAPSLIFEGTKDTFGAGRRAVIDSKGTVVGPQADFPAIKGLPSISDAAGFGARKGEPALSGSDVDFILNVIAQANKANVPIKSLVLPRAAQEIDLRTADREYYVKFYLGGDALTQSGQFLAARDRFDQRHKQPRQYLDVRVPGKVYYK